MTGMTKRFSVCETYRFYIGGKDLFAVEPVLLPACDPDQVSRHQANAGLVRAGGPAPYRQTLDNPHFINFGPIDVFNIKNIVE
jgi:hypothetical protein